MRRLRNIALALLPLLALAAPARAGQAVPEGWASGGSAAQDYEFGTDARPGATGKQAAYIKAKSGARLNGFGHIVQCIMAEKYLGQRLRLSARLQSVDAVRLQMFMRTDAADGRTILAFYNMADRPLTGTTGWQKEDIVLDVPNGAKFLCYGFFLAGGKGEGWVDSLSLLPVGRDVPISRMPPPPKMPPTAPVNLGFDR